MIGDDDDVGFDEDDPDEMTAVAGFLRDAGKTAEADAVADHVRNLIEERDELPAVHETGDALLAWLGDEWNDFFVEQWGDDFHGKLARAEAALEGSAYEEVFRRAVARGDKRTLTDLLLASEKAVRDLKMPVDTSHYSDEAAPPATSPTDRIRLQREIDRIHTEHPVGTDSYISKPVQNRLQMLYARLHGEDEIFTARWPGHTPGG
jgi:hypothetical protein